jgi:hypothetical protein
MAGGHSEQEWQELIKELRKVTNDPTRTREDRIKAQQILSNIHRPPTRATRSWETPAWAVSQTDLEFDGMIV